VAKFSTIPISEARMLVLPQRRAIQEQYRAYVQQLTADEGGRLELGPGDRPITERARLKAAAKAAGVNLHIQRQGNTIFFWLTTDEPKSSSKRSPGRKSSR
jgi:hypothetical protein